MESVGEDAGCVAVGEVEELEGHAFLVGGYAHGGEEHVDEAGVAGAFSQAIVLEGGEGD